MEGDVVKSFSANWSRSQLECQRVSVQGAENLHGQTSSALQTSVHAAEIHGRALSHETCSCRCGGSERERERQGSWI